MRRTRANLQLDGRAPQQEGRARPDTGLPDRVQHKQARPGG